jgi:hypothetical protein
LSLGVRSKRYMPNPHICRICRHVARTVLQPPSHCVCTHHKRDIEIESSHLPTGSPFPATGRKYALKPKSRCRCKQQHRFGFRSVEILLNCILARTPPWQVTRHNQRALLFCRMPASRRVGTGALLGFISGWQGWLEYFACYWVGFQWASMPSWGCTD